MRVLANLEWETDEYDGGKKAQKSPHRKQTMNSTFYKEKLRGKSGR